MKKTFISRFAALLVTLLVMAALLPVSAKADTVSDPQLVVPTDLSIVQENGKTYLQWNSGLSSMGFENNYDAAFAFEVYRGSSHMIYSMTNCLYLEDSALTLDGDIARYDVSDGSFTDGGYQFRIRNRFSGEDGQLSDWSPKSDIFWVGKDYSVIDTIDIYDASLSFWAGDAPKFTATSPYDLSGIQDSDEFERYQITYESWQLIENNEPIAAIYSNGKSPAPLNIISTFEDGKTYIYGLSLTAQDGFTFSDDVVLKINGRPVTNNASIKPVSNGKLILAAALTTLHPVSLKLIDTIELNNVTTSFAVGAAPVFTGTVPANAPYYINHEAWDGPNCGITTSEYWNGQYGDVEQSWGSLITAFQKDTTYYYRVYFKLTNEAYDAGYRFDADNLKLKLNGQIYPTNPSDVDTAVAWFSNVFSMIPTDSCAAGHKLKTTTTKATTSRNGTITKVCTVCSQTISSTTIAKASNIKLSASSYIYNGKAKTPSVTVKDANGKALKKNTDYTISYGKNRKNIGKYSVKITLKGIYSGSKTLSFTIVPKGTKLSKATASKGTMKISWKAQKSQTTGYQIQYSTSKNFKNAKTVTIKKNATTSAKIKKPNKQKKYYVRIRTYKPVGKNKFYSDWSASKRA